MNKSDVFKILKTALSLFLICAVAAGILAFINSVTSPIIETNDQKAADESRLQVLPEAKEFQLKENEGKAYYEGLSDGNTVGFVFTTESAGYGGAVRIMTGIDSEGKVTGISILSINETPGLGMNAKKNSFLSQYVGSEGPFTVIKNDKPEENEILAITSATITTNAVTKAVNEAKALFEEVKEG
ncbi:MAG: RnfABCDGE type electron transport complex subunit G [Clostridia bacterium]|nr:RnfABCDGE type electron transport complex subunit G [Clostridia bacterium]